MSINIIVAHGRNLELGVDNKLIWKLRQDLRRFKEITLGEIIVMGRKTAESIPSFPLLSRMNIVLSKELEAGVYFKDNKSYVVQNSTESILRLAKDREIYIIGGAEVYKAFLPFVDRLFITWVEGEFLQADTFFPNLPEQLIEANGWTLLENEYRRADDYNEYDTRFLIYEKKA